MTSPKKDSSSKKSPFDAFEKEQEVVFSPQGKKPSFFRRFFNFMFFGLFSPGTDIAQPKQQKTSETIKTVVVAFFIAMCIRSFLVQPFSIPSESMVPSLLVGDYLFVTKFSYGFSRYSFPFGLPAFSGRIFAGEVQRGDVVVFRVPKDENKDYIKRVIGLPGDRIRMLGGQLYINGQPVSRTYVQNYQGSTDNALSVGAAVYREVLPNGKSYLTLDVYQGTDYDDTPEYVVPAGHYFMMGDNRDNSQDSRYIGGPVGFVPFENIIGKAQMVFFSINTQQSGGTQGTGSYLRFDRLIHSID